MSVLRGGDQGFILLLGRPFSFVITRVVADGVVGSPFKPNPDEKSKISLEKGLKKVVEFCEKSDLQKIGR